MWCTVRSSQLLAGRYGVVSSDGQLTWDLSSSRVEDTLGHTWRQLLLQCASSLASSHVNPMSFKSRFRLMSCHFFRGLPGFLFTLVRYSAVLRPYHVHEPSQSSFFAVPVLFLTSTLLTLSYHFIPNSRRWNLWCAASSVFICLTVNGHNSAL